MNNIGVEIRKSFCNFSLLQSRKRSFVIRIKRHRNRRYFQNRIIQFLLWWYPCAKHKLEPVFRYIIDQMIHCFDGPVIVPSENVGKKSHLYFSFITHAKKLFVVGILRKETQL